MRRALQAFDRTLPGTARMLRTLPYLACVMTVLILVAGGSGAALAAGIALWAVVIWWSYRARYNIGRFASFRTWPWIPTDRQRSIVAPIGINLLVLLIVVVARASA